MCPVLCTQIWGAISFTCKAYIIIAQTCPIALWEKPTGVQRLIIHTNNVESKQHLVCSSTTYQTSIFPKSLIIFCEWCCLVCFTNPPSFLLLWHVFTLVLIGRYGNSLFWLDLLGSRVLLFFLNYRAQLSMHGNVSPWTKPNPTETPTLSTTKGMSIPGTFTLLSLRQ